MKLCTCFFSLFNIILLLLPHSETIQTRLLIPFIPRLKNYAAVTRFEGLSKFYFKTIQRNLRHRDLDKFRSEPTTPIELSSERNQLRILRGICGSILTSHFFNMRHEDYIDGTTDEVQAKIRLHNPFIFRSVYRGTVADGYQYESTYTERNVVVQFQKTTEKTITCVSQGRRFGEIREYFVSKLYDVNIDRSGLPMLGRFIFTRGRDDTFTLLALAEEAAQTADFFGYTRWVERFYLKRNPTEISGTVIPPTTNPICRLKPHHKIRLCATILGAEVFKRMKLKFTPTDAHVREQICQKKRISFTAPGVTPIVGALVRSLASKTRTYHEWVIDCKARTHDGDPVEYYVSSARQENEAFVFAGTSTDDRMVLHNWFTNVSVIGKDLE